LEVGKHFDDVGVAEFLKVLDFSVDLLRVSGVAKGILYFLQSTNSCPLFKLGLPNLPICALPHFLHHLEALQDMLVDAGAAVSLHCTCDWNYKLY